MWAVKSMLTDESSPALSAEEIAAAKRWLTLSRIQRSALHDGPDFFVHTHGNTVNWLIDHGLAERCTYRRWGRAFNGASLTPLGESVAALDSVVRP
jgi:hypothetical protein